MGLEVADKIWSAGEGLKVRTIAIVHELNDRQSVLKVILNLSLWWSETDKLNMVLESVPIVKFQTTSIACWQPFACI